MSVSPPRPLKGHFNMLYFAAATTYTQKDYEQLPAPLPLSMLFASLENRYSGIRAGVLDMSLVTINLEYVDVPLDSDGPSSSSRPEDGATSVPDIIIQEGDEVAIIPPVSSG